MRRGRPTFQATVSSRSRRRLSSRPLIRFPKVDGAGAGASLRRFPTAQVGSRFLKPLPDRRR
jgi:hypothetical protein